MLDRDEIDALFPPDLPQPATWEQWYPPRNLPEDAHVTRFCPSPTGFAHIGGVYVAMIDKAVAEQTGGTYFIRIEDTDQSREVEGATDQFDRAFGHFGVASQETDPAGLYGPYTQSDRGQTYMTYVREFLREGKAYLCFATKEELAAAAAEQRASKLPTGYYGRWAIWRDSPAELVRDRLAAGNPYVVRFRSPGEAAGRVTFTDVIRGEMEAEANRNDVVILKSSANHLRLPTYHFAHVVDDHLMR
ncbi:MAG: glutamate--tRNA ligase family protein, partial [Dehalococcoidia bacterium]